MDACHPGAALSLEYAPARELRRRLRRREVSAVELLDAAVARAERIAPLVNPFALKLYEQARAAAVEADRRLAAGTGGPLCGLPITVKDSQWLAGVRCANGARRLRGFVPDRTSAAIERLQRAGAVIFAKTTCPEYSLIGITDSRLYGRTANPWNLERTPGGSSGGAGAALAAGAGCLSLGGDGGGSIRIPAAFCGVVGFKPTFGAVPREPCFPSWKSLVAYGPMARNVADARLMYSVLTGTAEAPAVAPGGLAGVRLAVSEDLGSAPLDDDVRARFREVCTALQAAGAELVYDHPGLPSSAEVWALIATYDAARHDPDHHGRDIEHITRAVLDFGADISDERFEAAQAQREPIAAAYRSLFERTGAAALLTPSLGCEAFEHGRIHPESVGGVPIGYPWLDWAGFLYDANLVGMPACAVPMGFGDEYLPLSLQIQGQVGDDVRVLEIAERIEGVIGSAPHPVQLLPD